MVPSEIVQWRCGVVHSADPYIDPCKHQYGTKLFQQINESISAYEEYPTAPQRLITAPLIPRPPDHRFPHIASHRFDLHCLSQLAFTRAPQHSNATLRLIIFRYSSFTG